MKKKTKIIKELIKFNSNFENYIERNNDKFILDFPNKNNIGGLVIQFNEDEDIFLRNYHPYSIICFDTINNLIEGIQMILNDELIFAIGIKKDKWVETLLIFPDKLYKQKKGVSYKHLSWSGKFDN